jgi:hypothetical protein
VPLWSPRDPSSSHGSLEKAAHGSCPPWAVQLRPEAICYAAWRRVVRFRFGLVLGGRGFVSPSGTSRCAKIWWAANGMGGIACRQAAHWQRVWYMLVGLLRTSWSSLAANRRERPQTVLDLADAARQAPTSAEQECTRLLAKTSDPAPNMLSSLPLGIVRPHVHPG